MTIKIKITGYPKAQPKERDKRQSITQNGPVTALSALLLLCWLLSPVWASSQDKKTKWPDNIQETLDCTEPLKYTRGSRLPLYVWSAMKCSPLSDEDAEKLVTLLNQRGIGMICTWRPGNVEQSLAQCLPIARAQKKLGLKINIHATYCLNFFFNGDPNTAHIDENGKPFFDTSLVRSEMGCPFAIDFRRDDIRNRLLPFVEKYQQENLPIGFIFTDWEIDGPIEWNDAWKACRRCQRCRQHIPEIDNFLAFQKAMRQLRSELQRDVYANTILDAFPEALVGNYAVYPNNGYRYWNDWFEYYVDGQPALTDQRAHYRHWYNEFPLTGYTFAMPVVYTWYPIFSWYDFEDTDWRWFYNMLLVASNAGQYTPSDIPIIPFVHWNTTSPPKDADPNVRQLSKEKYQELLWHMLLRGHDTFFVFCFHHERKEEISLAHKVWAEAQKYGPFLENGVPVNFEVPKKPAPVVSALRLGNSLLVRRTDFTDCTKPVKLKVGTRTIMVERNPGTCTILPIN